MLQGFITVLILFGIPLGVLAYYDYQYFLIWDTIGWLDKAGVFASIVLIVFVTLFFGRAYWEILAGRARAAKSMSVRILDVYDGLIFIRHPSWYWQEHNLTPPADPDAWLHKWAKQNKKGLWEIRKGFTWDAAQKDAHLPPIGEWHFKGWKTSWKDD